MFSGNRKGRWCGWRAMLFFVVMYVVGMFPSSGHAKEFPQNLRNFPVGTEMVILPLPHVMMISQRASAAMVGTIMALLATFDETGVLPPEGTVQANQVIHGLIQLQSAFMKSPSEELARYRKHAVTHWVNGHKDRESAMVEDKGLTGRMLAALIVYDVEHPLWDESKIVSAMQAFNVTRADWIVIVALFHQAEKVFQEQGRSFSIAYEFWQMTLSDAKALH